ncbi:MAG: tRNA-binding protein, partial [Chlamydiae bacterium]|nr:tRNA-binding protein [Chlamydiota bacterium]
EVLVLGLSDASHAIVLVGPNQEVPNGQQLH